MATKCRIPRCPVCAQRRGARRSTRLRRDHLALLASLNRRRHLAKCEPENSKAEIVK
jgi:hypothetical protein